MSAYEEAMSGRAIVLTHSAKCVLGEAQKHAPLSVEFCFWAMSGASVKQVGPRSRARDNK